MRIKAKDILYKLIFIYPLLNIIVCYIFHGDNMNLFCLIYCSILVGIYCNLERRISKWFFLGLFFLMAISILEFLREENISNFVIYIMFIMTNIIMYMYSEKKFNIIDFANSIYENYRLYMIGQMGFVGILILYVLKNGLTYGWNTMVLQGPYNYPHTLAYLALFLLIADAFLYLEYNMRLALIFMIIQMGIILLTAVRTTLLIVAVVAWYFLVNLAGKKQIKKILFIVLLTCIVLSVAYRQGIFNALIEKTSLALANSTLTNGRGKIALTSLKALENGNLAKNLILGIGISNLMKWNQVYLLSAIHAHNDFVDAIVCYGVVALIIYLCNLYCFSQKKVVWILATIGMLAFSNGLFEYIDCMPLLIYARLLFEARKKEVSPKNKMIIEKG